MTLIADLLNVPAGVVRAVAKTPGTDLYILGNFTNARSDVEIAALLFAKRNDWTPDIRDFHQLARQSGGQRARIVVVNDPVGFVNAIARQGKRSIRTLHVITHGEPGKIGLSGTTSRLSVNPRHELTRETLAKLRETAFTPDNRKRPQTWRDVRERFAPGAVLHIVACSSGVESDLLKDLASAFGVKVRAYRPRIRFEPRPPSPRAPRSQWKLQVCTPGKGECTPQSGAATVQKLLQRAQPGEVLEESPPVGR